jgi:Flagellar FliJ protein.
MGEQGVVLNGLQLHEYRSFLANLGRAIEEQEALLVKMRQEYAALQRTWRQAHCRSEGIGKVQKKWLRFEQDCLDKQVQRELDDRAAAKRRKTRAK